MALRLYAIVSKHKCSPIEDAEDLQKWKDVLYGQAETVSDANEQAWRATLLHVCDTIVERAHEGVQKCSSLESLSQIKDPSWVEFQRRNLEMLWREELEVAIAVARSVRDGEIF